MKISVIEIGTNSTKFIITEKNDNGFSTLLRISEINRLSSGMYTEKLISKGSLDKTLQIIGNFKELSDKYQAKLIYVFSTSVLRDAVNRNEISEEIKKAFGVNLQVISGEREAYLANRGCSQLVSHNNEKFSVIDIGGGSTEVSIGDIYKVNEKRSFDIGAVRLTELFIKNNPIDRAELTACLKYIEKCFGNFGGININGIRLIGTGGTLKSLGTIFKQVDYLSVEEINGVSIGLKDIRRICNLLSSMSLEERKKVTGLNPKRGDVIVAGICILIKFMEGNGIDSITISSNGVLEGYVSEYFSNLS